MTAVHKPLLHYTSAARTHAGARRALNEDQVLENPGHGVWAIADGMGGHGGGAAAAGRVVAALETVEHGRSGFARLAALRNAAEQVNAELFRGQADGTGGVSGSTLVALLIHDRHFACLWAGDSRAYLLREGSLSRITRDHSVVQDLVDSGTLPEAERNSHPQAHVITRAIGGAPELVLDQAFAAVLSGDAFLLCSDGLTACVTDTEIAQELQASPAHAASRLLNLALTRAPADNVSLIVVRAE